MGTDRTETTISDDANPWRRWWWVPVLLALLIIGIIAGAYLATHPHAFGGSATSTPTSTPRPTATPIKKVVVVVKHTPTPTRTPRPAPTGTPRPGPTGTPIPAPKPAPTATPRPAPHPRPTATPRPTPPHPTATPAGSIRTGVISYTQSQLNTLQQGANAGNPQYTYYLNPFQVVQHDLPKYGFPNGFTVVSPSPQPTPTPFTNQQGQPEVHITVQAAGHRYLIVLTQPVQQGPKGIWVITAIRQLS